MPKWAGVLHVCPSRVHLLKVGVPLLGRDDELDPLVHVVLKLTGGEEGKGGAAVSSRLGGPASLGRASLAADYSTTFLALMLRSEFKSSFNSLDCAVLEEAHHAHLTQT